MFKRVQQCFPSYFIHGVTSYRTEQNLFSDYHVPFIDQWKKLPFLPRARLMHSFVNRKFHRSSVSRKESSTEKLHSFTFHPIPTATTSATVSFTTEEKNVGIVRQWKNKDAQDTAVKIASWLEDNHSSKVIILLDNVTLESEMVKDFRKVDFIICIGGDGTLLYLNSLFQADESVPPVLPLAMGSLGFMCPYQVNKYKSLIERIFDPKPSHVTMRMRLGCTFFPGEGRPKNPNGDYSVTSFSAQSGTSTPFLDMSSYQVLNEVAITRGKEPYVNTIELYVNEELVTLVMGDGIVIATATGSTAYSMSAGGPMLPPAIPAIIVTPICPHSLSFRPLVLPVTCKLSVRISPGSRSPSLVYFDGRLQQPMYPLDRVNIEWEGTHGRPPHPLPTFNILDSTVEWFRSIHSRLHWNVRHLQKPFFDTKGNITTSGDDFEKE